MLRRLIAFVVCILLVCPTLAKTESLSKRYETAITQLNSSDYAGAVETFRALGEYEDSTKFYIYAAALQMLDDGQYEDAELNFTLLGEFKSSRLYIQYTRVRRFEADKAYVMAVQGYKELGMFSDSRQRIEQIRALADEYVAGEAFDDAAAVLKAFPGEVQLREYVQARLDENSGAYESAIASYRSLGDFYDSKDRIQAIRDQADLLFKQGDDSKALTFLKLYPDDREAKAKIAEIKARIFLYPYIDELGKYGYIGKDGTFTLFPKWDYADEFYQGVARVREGPKFGLIDASGAYVAEPQWDYIESFYDEFAICPDEPGITVVRKGEGFGLMDVNGQMLQEPIWDSIFSFHNSFYRVMKGYKYGLVNSQGCVVLEPAYDDINAADLSKDLDSYDLIPVRISKKWGFTNLSGEMVITPEWDDAIAFSEGLSRVKKGDLYGFIDKSGQIKIAPAWQYARSFDEGLSVVFTGTLSDYGWPEEGKYGLIDEDGQLVVDTVWDMIGSFNDGIALVLQGEKYGYINKNGVLIVKPTLEYGMAFDGGVAVIKRDGNYFLIDTTGTIILDLPFDFVSRIWGDDDAPENKLLVFSGILDEKGWPSQGKFGIIDTTGAFIVQQVWDFLAVTPEGYSPCMKNGLWGLMNSSFSIAIPPVLPDLRTFPGYLKKSESNGKCGFVDPLGRYLIEPVWDDVGYSFEDGLCSVKRDGMTGAMNVNGDSVIEPVWESDYDLSFYDGRAWVSVDGTHRYIDMTGNLIPDPYNW